MQRKVHFLLPLLCILSGILAKDASTPEKNCVEFSVADIEKYMAGLDLATVPTVETMIAGYKCPVSALPFGALKSDWARLILLYDAQPPKSILKEKLRQLYRLLVVAYYEMEETYDMFEPVGEFVTEKSIQPITETAGMPVSVEAKRGRVSSTIKIEEYHDARNRDPASLYPGKSTISFDQVATVDGSIITQDIEDYERNARKSTAYDRDDEYDAITKGETAPALGEEEDFYGQDVRSSTSRTDPPYKEIGEDNAEEITQPGEDRLDSFQSFALTTTQESSLFDDYTEASVEWIQKNTQENEQDDYFTSNRKLGSESVDEVEVIMPRTKNLKTRSTIAISSSMMASAPTVEPTFAEDPTHPKENPGGTHQGKPNDEMGYKAEGTTIAPLRYTVPYEGTSTDQDNLKNPSEEGLEMQESSIYEQHPNKVRPTSVAPNDSTEADDDVQPKIPDDEMATLMSYDSSLPQNTVKPHKGTTDSVFGGITPQFTVLGSVEVSHAMESVDSEGGKWTTQYHWEDSMNPFQTDQVQIVFPGEKSRPPTVYEEDNVNLEDEVDYMTKSTDSLPVTNIMENGNLYRKDRDRSREKNHPPKISDGNEKDVDNQSEMSNKWIRGPKLSRLPITENLSTNNGVTEKDNYIEDNRYATASSSEIDRSLEDGEFDHEESPEFSTASTADENHTGGTEGYGCSESGSPNTSRETAVVTGGRGATKGKAEESTETYDGLLAKMTTPGVFGENGETSNVNSGLDTTVIAGGRLTSRQLFESTETYDDLSQTISTSAAPIDENRRISNDSTDGRSPIANLTSLMPTLKAFSDSTTRFYTSTDYETPQLGKQLEGSLTIVLPNIDNKTETFITGEKTMTTSQMKTSSGTFTTEQSSVRKENGETGYKSISVGENYDHTLNSDTEETASTTEIAPTISPVNSDPTLEVTSTNEYTDLTANSKQSHGTNQSEGMENTTDKDLNLYQYSRANTNEEIYPAEASTTYGSESTKFFDNELGGGLEEDIFAEVEADSTTVSSTESSETTTNDRETETRDDNKATQNALDLEGVSKTLSTGGNVDFNEDEWSSESSLESTTEESYSTGKITNYTTEYVASTDKILGKELEESNVSMDGIESSATTRQDIDSAEIMSEINSIGIKRPGGITDRYLVSTSKGYETNGQTTESTSTGNQTETERSYPSDKMILVQNVAGFTNQVIDSTPSTTVKIPKDTIATYVSSGEQDTSGITDYSRIKKSSISEDLYTRTPSSVPTIRIGEDSRMISKSIGITTTQRNLESVRSSTQPNVVDRRWKKETTEVHLTTKYSNILRLYKPKKSNLGPVRKSEPGKMEANPLIFKKPAMGNELRRQDATTPSIFGNSYRPKHPLFVPARVRGGAEEPAFVPKGSLRGRVTLPGPKRRGGPNTDVEKLYRWFYRQGRKPEADEPRQKSGKQTISGSD